MHGIERVLATDAGAEAEAVRRELGLVGFPRAIAESLVVRPVGDATGKQHRHPAVARVHEADMTLGVLSFRQAAGDNPGCARRLDQVLGIDQSADECQTAEGSHAA